MLKRKATPKPLNRKQITKAVADLFVGGDGRRASRLVLVDDTKRPDGDWDLGGWCKEAIVRQLCQRLGVQE